MYTCLNNDFNLVLDMLSQYASTISPNIDFVRGTRGRRGKNISSVTVGGRVGNRGRGKFGYRQGEGEGFGCVKGRGGRCGRGGRGGCGAPSGGCVETEYQKSYNNNGRQNHNHGVDTSDLTRNFKPEEVSALIQGNVWDYICAE